MSTYSSLSSNRDSSITTSLGMAQASNTTISNDKKRITPSTINGNKIDISNTDLNPQAKGFRVYSAARYLNDHESTFISGVKKVACGVATFFRRLAGQAIDVQIGEKTVTVNKNSFSKYLVRQITGINTPNPKDIDATTLYNKACKVAYTAFKKDIDIDAKTITLEILDNIKVVAKDNETAISNLKKALGQEIAIGVFDPKKDTILYKLKQKIRDYCNQLDEQFVECKTVNIDKESDFSKSSTIMRESLSQVIGLLKQAEQASEKIAKAENLKNDLYKMDRGSSALLNEALDPLDKSSRCPSKESYYRTIDDISDQLENLINLLKNSK